MGIDGEKLQHIVDKYHQTDDLRVSDAFLDGGTGGGSHLLGARLMRAAINQAGNGSATPSRYGIWANTVRDHVLAAERMTRSGASEGEILEHLRIAANSLSAFADIQSLLDRESVGSEPE